MADFSGKLSPMLVKELRQGLRTNFFVVAFILLQAFMVLVLMAGLANPNSNDADGFFWFFIVVTLLVVQPLRGFNALSSEISLKTLELIQLTKLTGWRIVIGKWTALNAQSLLFIAAVLPYLVIRYFLGNVDFVNDLLLLGFLGLGSALATSITIGISVFKSVLLRGVIVGAMMLLVMNTGTFIGFGMMRGFSVGASTGYVVTALLFCYGCFFFLTFGASRIAPRSENIAWLKRSVALAIAFLSISIFATSLEEEIAIIISGVILGLAGIDALTEPLPIYSRVLSGARKSPLRRFTSIFLTPGWTSGIAFYLLCGLLWLGVVCLVNLAGGDVDFDDLEFTVVLLSCFNLILFPLLIIHAFFPRHASSNFTFGIYFFIQAALGMLTILLVVMANSLDFGEEMIALFVPCPSVLLAMAAEGSLDHFIYVIIAILTTFLCVVIPLLRNREAVREFARNLKRDA